MMDLRLGKEIKGEAVWWSSVMLGSPVCGWLPFAIPPAFDGLAADSGGKS